MRSLEVSVIEWPDGPEHGGPRLLGSTSDPELVQAALDHLAADRRRELAALEGGVPPGGLRLVPRDPPADPDSEPSNP